MALPNLLDPYAQAHLQMQGLQNLNQGVAGLGQGMQQLGQDVSQMRPENEAVKRGIAAILNGTHSPEDAAHATRAHMLMPDSADHIWSQPPASQHPAVVGQANPPVGAPAEGPIEESGRPPEASSPSGLAQPVAQPQGHTVNVTINKPGAPDIMAGWTRGDTARIGPLLGNLALPEKLAASQARLEERLNSVERVASENRTSKEGIAATAEQGRNDRFTQAIKQKTDQMNTAHQDRLRSFLTQLAVAKQHTGTSLEVAAINNAQRAYDSLNSGLVRDMSSDVSLAKDPAFQNEVKRMQDEINQYKPIMEQLRARASANLKAPPAHSQAAPMVPGAAKNFAAEIQSALQGGQK